MATNNPRIRYDITANPEGSGEVDRLATSLERLDEAIDPEAAARAARLTNELRELGQQQAALQRFQELSAATAQAKTNLTGAETALAAMRAELSATAAPTTAQTSRMERLSAAVEAARVDLTQQNVALDASRGRLAAFGLDAGNAAAAEGRLASETGMLRDALASLGRTLPGVRVGQLVSELREIGQQQQAIATFRALETNVERAATALNRAEGELGTYLAKINAAGPPTLAQVQGQQRFAFAVDDARAKLVQQTAALATGAAGLQRLGVDVGTLAGAEERLAASSQRAVAGIRELALQQNAANAATRQANTETGQLAATQARMPGQLNATTAAIRTQGSALDGLRGQLNTLRNIAAVALGGSLVGQLAKDVSETADAVANLRGRMRLVVGDGPELQAVFNNIADIALRTNAELESTGTLFARIAAAGRDFNLTRADALALTESINQAVAVSGTGVQASQAALTQLIQGLQSGVLRGEEFNSIMEQSPRLARALADGLGVTTGELRKMAEQGALTTQVVLDTLRGQAATLQREYAQLPPTVGRAITNLSTAWSLYVDEVDRAGGVSQKVAGFINGLAGNLDTLIAVLFGVGKAAAAFTALRLADAFISGATAARTAAVATAAATAATTAHTAATVANTAAQTANAAATAGTVASAGRLAGLLSTLKTLSLIGIVTNLESIGTAIGEGIAKWMGYGKAIDENEAKIKAQAEAARVAAAQNAEFAAKAELAADKAAGLTKEAKAIVQQFEGLEKKGESTAEALAKVGKELDLSDVKGIQTATAALDELGKRGKISGDQIRDTLGGALKGLDLGTFEAKARAAFDTSERGAKRLRTVLDAIAEESLKRAGTSVRELQTGFSEASTSAINDVDAVAKSLDDMGVVGGESSQILVRMLDKATEATNTERALKAVEDRITAMGAAGKLTKDQVVDMLDKVRTKADELRPGINSLAEAFKTLGIKSRDEAQATADKYGQAYKTIATAAGVTIAQKIEAFGRWRTAAMEANGGVETAEIKLQATILKTQSVVAGQGEVWGRSMGTAKRHVREVIDEVYALGERLNQVAGSLGKVSSIDQIMKEGGKAFEGFEGASDDSFNSLYNRTPDGGITREGGGQLQPPDNSGDYFLNTARRGEGPFGLGVWELTPAGKAKRDAAEAALTGPAARAKDPGGMNGGSGYSPFGRYERSQAAQPGPITINLPGYGSATLTGTRDQADRFLELLTRSAQQTGGG